MGEEISRLDRVEAGDGVRAAVADYCHAVDSRDYERLRELFVEDAVLGDPVAHQGREAVLAYYVSVLSALTFSRHHTSNQVVKMIAPDVAIHTSYFVALIDREDGHSVLVLGSYLDRLVYRNNAWRYAEKVNRVTKTVTLNAGWQ
jgi:ketosteroid isomerase-like protein